MVNSKKISMVENPKQSQSCSEIYVIAIAMENKITSLCGIGSLFRRHFLEAILGVILDVFWRLIGMLIWMLIGMIIVMIIGTLIGTLIVMLISVQNSINF